MFLLRTAFWLTVVILILPTDKKSSETVNAEPAGYSVSASSLIGAATDTFSDVSGICERNPAVCETGQAALQAFGEKASYGAQLVMDFVAEQNNGTSAAPTSVAIPVDARSAVQAPVRPAAASQNTLSQDDLAPNWGGPLVDEKA